MDQSPHHLLLHLHRCHNHLLHHLLLYGTIYYVFWLDISYKTCLEMKFKAGHIPPMLNQWNVAATTQQLHFIFQQQQQRCYNITTLAWKFQSRTMEIEN